MNICKHAQVNRRAVSSFTHQLIGNPNQESYRFNTGTFVFWHYVIYDMHSEFIQNFIKDNFVI